MQEETKSESTTAGRASSDLTADQQESLDVYAARLKHKPITPRQWLKEHPRLPIDEAFRRQLWHHFNLAYPSPKIPGFVVEDILGEGGMGQVYLCRDTELERWAALKELTGELRRSAHFQERFHLEAKVLAKLDHPNIVKVYQFLKHEGREFIALEYVDQGSLADRLTSGRAEPPDAAATLLAKLARAIGYAHDEKIIHRDLKPGNILFDKRGEPKISDFGLAKNLLDLTDRTRGMSVGTVYYMAPEQTEGKPPVPGTDIWALGVILYRLLTGKLPFTGDNQGEVFTKIRMAPPPAFGSDVPAVLQAICLKCLAKDPANRYRRGEDLAKDLEANVAPAPPRRPPLPRKAFVWALAAAVSAMLLIALAAVGVMMRSGTSANLPVMMKDRHAGYCSSIVFTADGQRAISENGGGEIAVWDLKSRMKEISHPHGFNAPDANQAIGGMVAASPNGNYFAGADVNIVTHASNMLTLYDPRTCKPIRAPLVFASGIRRTMAFSSDSTKLATAGSRGFFSKDYFIIMIDVPAGASKEFPCISPVSSVAFAPHGKHIAAGGDDNSLRVWRLEPFAKDADFAGHSAAVDQVGFSDDGNQIYSASTGDNSLRVWNKDGKEVRQIDVRKNASRMTCAIFGKGGRALTGHVDGHVVLWDLTTGQERYRFQHQNTHPTAIALSSDGRHALAALKDHSVFHYGLAGLSARK